MNDLKLIIFDMDGTLYELNDVIKMNFQIQLDFYSKYTGKNKEEVLLIFRQNNIYPALCEKSKSATEFFLQMGVDLGEWNKYRETHFDVSRINIENAVQPELMKKFNKKFHLVLLSSNSKNNVQKILKHINIPTTLFDEIICSDNKYDVGPFKKINEMRLLAKKRGIPIESLLSIGDRFKTDVEPLIKLGGMGIVISGPQDLFDVYETIREMFI